MARVVPNNKEAEQSLLSSMFISKYALEKATDTLTVDDFYYDNNRIIFNVLDNLNKTNTKWDSLKNTLGNYLNYTNGFQVNNSSSSELKNNFCDII